MAKGFIMILRFSIEETLQCKSVATADPRHTLLPFDVFASPTLGSGSDAVLVYFVPPGGMPGAGGWGAVTAWKAATCHSVPFSLFQ